MVVVYERSGAVSAADQAKAAADAKQFATVSRVSGRVVGPVPSKDRRALEVIVPIKMGANGWKDLAPRSSRSARSPTMAAGRST